MKLRTLSVIIAVIILTSLWAGCNGKRPNAQHSAQPNDYEVIVARDTLRVITLSSSTSYFMYRGEYCGYEYELIKRFADDHGLKLEIILADNYTQMLQKLHDGEGDIVAYDIPVTMETLEDVLHCGPVKETHQVIVQRKANRITDVIDLVGKEVYVEDGSKYEERMINLNNEIGGGINIICINRDTVVVEDLIDMVAKGEISYTVADNYIARINSTYYNNLDLNLAVSFKQRSQWAVRKDSPHLAAVVDEWAAQTSNDVELKALSKRYFEESKATIESSIMSIADGRISPYDEIFKQQAARIEWDWRLLAAMAYHESRFNPDVVSWVGARGIMQLMPRTAEAFGLSLDSIALPEPNVRTAVETLKVIDRMMKDVTNPEERVMFVLAGYNAGVGHLIDAVKLAEKYGKNPQKWYGEVEEAMMMKSHPDYYNDDVCTSGYFRATQTIAYVRNVMTQYQYYCEKIPQ